MFVLPNSETDVYGMDPINFFKRGDEVAYRGVDLTTFSGVVTFVDKPIRKIHVSWMGNIKQHDPEELVLFPFGTDQKNMAERYLEQTVGEISRRKERMGSDRSYKESFTKDVFQRKMSLELALVAKMIDDMNY